MLLQPVEHRRVDGADPFDQCERDLDAEAFERVPAALGLVEHDDVHRLHRPRQLIGKGFGDRLRQSFRLDHRLLLAAMLFALAGCATGPDRRDPFEPFNRRVLQFNDDVDGLVLKPVATAYRATVPAPLRTGVNNFFSNLSDAWSTVNALLQLKLPFAAENLMRVSINTVFGFGGILDIASEAGLERHREDFGQTLGHYGLPPGPYLVLPLLGPSTVRDTAALGVDWQGDPVTHINPDGTRTVLRGVRIVDTRANLLRATSVMDEVALDRYTFIREAHLQRRRAEIFESDPPEIPEEPKE